MARAADHMIAYEMERYNAQRPIAYTSWPTLDPLRHPTESTAPEEAALLRSMGEGETAETIERYEECEDCVGVDAAHIVPTSSARGGDFATYHAYPYYPDFMNLDPGYARARDSEGPSNYIGYLRDLKAHHLAHQTFADVDALDRAIHHAVDELNAERTVLPLAEPRISA